MQTSKFLFRREFKIPEYYENSMIIIKLKVFKTLIHFISITLWK